jgi:hypothetical protein
MSHERRTVSDRGPHRRRVSAQVLIIVSIARVEVVLHATCAR